jgi:hypothetical protein
MFFSCTRHEFVRSATACIPIEGYLLARFGQISRPISDSDFIPESPLYCPRNDFHSIRNTRYCHEGTLCILRATKRLIGTTLATDTTLGEEREADLGRYETAKSGLTILLSATSSRGSMHGDYVYECCRLAAVMMMRAIDTTTPFRDLHTDMVSELKAAMQKTDIGNTWGQMSGVLFWIALVGSSAAIGKPQHSYMDSVLRRLIYELTYKNPIFEVVTIATWNFIRIQSILGNGGKHLG